MNLEEHEIIRMSIADIAKYMDEQKKLGKERERTQEEIAKIRGVSLKTLRNQTKPFREKREQTRTIDANSSTQETQESTNDVQESTEIVQENAEKVQENTSDVQESTPMNNPFNDDEIKVLKQIVGERKADIELFHEYKIYGELERVPIDEETVRSAFTMSKGTTEKLKRFSQVRRIPLQDLVELAVINLLEKYDK
jgi:hypothetical protein